MIRALGVRMRVKDGGGGLLGEIDGRLLPGICHGPVVRVGGAWVGGRGGETGGEGAKEHLCWAPTLLHTSSLPD